MTTGCSRLGATKTSVDVLEGLWKADGMSETRQFTVDERRQEFYTRRRAAPVLWASLAMAGGA